MRLYDINELKDSRMFYEQKSPRIISYFLMMVSVLMVTLLVFLSIAQKTYTVEASGYVMDENTTYVSSSVNGTVNKLYKEEGDYVEEGEIILEVTRESNKTEIDTLHQKLEQTNKKLDAIDLFDQSLKQDINYLDNTKEQQEYFEKMNYYLLLKSEEETSNSNLVDSIQKKQQKLSEVKEQKNHQEDAAEKEILDQEIESLDQEIQELQQQLDSASQVEKTKAQFLSELGSARTQLEDEKLEIEISLQIADGETSTYLLKAVSSGYLHYVTSLSTGISVQMNEVIGEISMDNKDQYYVLAYIPAYERMKVTNGSSVKIAVSGMDSQIYGMLDGKVDLIDKGTLMQESDSGKIPVYKCKVQLNKANLEKGKFPMEIVRSLPVNVYVIYDKETYMDWLLGLLNFQ